MFDNISEGVEVYKSKVKEYLKWMGEEGYDKISIDQIMALGTAEYEEVMRWNHIMQGMAQALGLTEEEIKTIDVECGILMV